MGKQITKCFLVAMWLAACIYVLHSYWTNELAWVNSEISTIFFLKMTLLTFPIGVITVTIGEYVISGLSLFGLELPVYFGKQATTIVTWSIMTLSGFYQWFVIVPKLFKRALQN